MDTTPPTGLCLVFPEANCVATEPFPLTPPAASEVLVKTSVSLLSTGTETIAYARKFDAGTHWDNWVKYPFYPGYASVGVVQTVGDGVTSLQSGDTVAYRQSHRSHGTLKAELCFRVPDGVAPEDAVWLPLAKIAGHGVRAARIRLGESVAVIGAGPIGQMALRWCLASGASRVLVIDTAEIRLKMAAGAGAIPIALPADQSAAAVQNALGGARPRVVIDTTGNAAVLRAAFELVATGGTVVLLGDSGSPGSQTLTGDVITRGLTLVGAHDVHNSPQWNNPVAADSFFALVGTGRFSLAGLNTHAFTPDRCKEAYDFAVRERILTMGIHFDWTGIQ